MSDIRWKQRFHNYEKAFSQLSRFMEKENLNEMEEQGLIQAFEYTFELAWKTLQDFFGRKRRLSRNQWPQTGHNEIISRWLYYQR